MGTFNLRQRQPRSQQRYSYFTNHRLGSALLFFFLILIALLQLFTMSSSITIPTRTGYGESNKAATSSSSSSSFSSPRTPQQQQQQSATPTSSTSKYRHDRRPSLLSSSLSKQEHTVINIGDPDGVPRLITCVRSSQGYEWNPEIFLPSYVESNFESLERKRDPVHEIRLSDEEIKEMFPQ